MALLGDFVPLLLVGILHSIFQMFTQFKKILDLPLLGIVFHNSLSAFIRQPVPNRRHFLKLAFFLRRFRLTRLAAALNRILLVF